LPIKPSWVWLNEMALVRLLMAAVVRLICASNRMETANPAASPSGEVIVEPDNNRAKDFVRMLDDSESNRELLEADIFVLITTMGPSVSYPSEEGVCDCLTASLPRKQPNQLRVDGCSRASLIVARRYEQAFEGLQKLVRASMVEARLRSLCFSRNILYRYLLAKERSKFHF
jgi:hypothetical protein